VTRTAASESARGGARSVRASAATIPLSGYGREGLNLRRFFLFGIGAGPLVGDEEAAVRALEARMPVGPSGHELCLERLAAMRAGDLVGAFRGLGVSHGRRIATRADRALRSPHVAPAAYRTRLGLCGTRPDRAQARGGDPLGQPRAALGGGPLRHGPRRRPSHVLRNR